jgi:putative nucleotidyltransferase with HDIG domain
MLAREMLKSSLAQFNFLTTRVKESLRPSSCRPIGRSRQGMAETSLLRVLFVDDERSLLDGLRRSLRSMRDVWHMSFANSGQEALDLMAVEPVHVVVSDMRMPNIDGLELLTRVRELYPETVRIVLSGQTEMQTALRSVSIAQAFLHKPSEPDVIKQAIMRALELSGELENDAIRRMVAKVEALPSPPDVVRRLNECLLRPEADLAEIAAISSSDPAITAKLLQLANSSFFGVSRPVLDVEDAINLLGISTVRDLAAGSKLFEALAADLDPSHITRFEAHSNRVAQLASSMCSDGRIARETFSAGILHDVGQLVIAVGFPEESREIEARTSAGESRCDVEMELFGVTHASVGAHLLRLWGLPSSVVEAVAWHHSGTRHEPWEMNAIHSTFLAEMIADELDPGALLPDDYLTALGLDAAALQALVTTTP